MAAFRAFIGVDLAPLPALEGVLGDLSNVRGLKTVDSSSLHVTMKFLGDTEESLVPSIGEVMRDSCRGISPFEVEVVGSGVFPPKGGARVVWAGMRGAEPLVEIASRLEKGMQAMGFAPEGRAFKAHLTLARVKDPTASAEARRIAEAHVQGKFGVVGVKEIYLKRSVLRPQGPEYSTVLTIPLQG